MQSIDNILFLLYYAGSSFYVQTNEFSLKPNEGDSEMAKMLLVIFPDNDHIWHFSRMFEVDCIPRKGETKLHCDQQL